MNLFLHSCTIPQVTIYFERFAFYLFPEILETHKESQQEKVLNLMATAYKVCKDTGRLTFAVHIKCFLELEYMWPSRCIALFTL